MRLLKNISYAIAFLICGSANTSAPEELTYPLEGEVIETSYSANLNNAELDTKVQELAGKTHELFEECRETYRTLCKQVLKDIIDELAAKNIVPEAIPGRFQLSGPLTDISSYKMNVTFSLETPHIIAQTRFEFERSKTKFFTWQITPVVDVTLPLQQPSFDMMHPYFDRHALHSILAHELGHIWHFDVLKRIKLSLGFFPAFLGTTIASSLLIQKMLLKNNPSPGRILASGIITQLWATGLGVIAQQWLASRARRQESQADAFSCTLATTEHDCKHVLYVMAKWYATEALSTIIINSIDNILYRLYIQLNVALSARTHPYTFERMQMFLCTWEQLHASHLVANGMEQEKAIAQAHQTVREEYIAMIEQMHEFEPNNLERICRSTFYQWTPDTEEKRNKIRTGLDMTRLKLLSLTV